MLAEVVRTHPGRNAATPAPTGVYAARARLRALRDALLAAKSRPKPSRWAEPVLFFFHRQRQLELEAARQQQLVSNALAERIADEVAALSQSVELRQAARAVPGLREAVQASPLAEMLAVPDDENVLVLHPERRLGWRLTVRGIATVNQFQVILQAAIDQPLPSRFTIACRDAAPSIPAGVPMVAELPYQCFRPSALQPDGRVPEAFRGSDHWLWGWEPMATAPRIDGDRVILLGEPAYPQRWDVERRFPAMAATAELQDVLNPFQVADRLSRIAGTAIPVHRREVRGPMRVEARSAA